jgi:hypothetical protein
MMRTKTVTFVFFCQFAAPLLAQTSIGGGTCNSGTLNGAYAITISGRSFTGNQATGTLTGVFEAIGSVTFDGLSKATFAVTADTNQASGTALNWTGTYSVQANCLATVTITSGGNGTFNLVLYAGGADFLMTGNDSTYAYSASGNSQPSGCSAALLSGVYSITAQGYYGPGASTAGGAGAATGLLQFDGTSNVTVNLTVSANGAQGGQTQTLTGIAYTGTYTVSSSCMGTAMVSNANGSAVLTFSVYAQSKLATTAFYVGLASASHQFMLNGTSNAIYGQPTTAPSTAQSLGSADERPEV